MSTELVERPGNPVRYPSAHQHIADTGEHGAVERWQVGYLNLLEKVDADRMCMPVSRERHFDER